MLHAVDLVISHGGLEASQALLQTFLEADAEAGGSEYLSSQAVEAA